MFFILLQVRKGSAEPTFNGLEEVPDGFNQSGEEVGYLLPESFILHNILDLGLDVLRQILKLLLDIIKIDIKGTHLFKQIDEKLTNLG